MRPESVDHEFVNATIRAEERHEFEIGAQRWNRSLNGSDVVLEALIDLVRDWGTGLELSMYEAALTDFIGGEEKVLRDVTVCSDERIVGRQPMRLVRDDIAFRLTGFESDNDGFEDHARRLLRHVDLRAILWVNIGLHRVTFTSLE